MNKYSSASSLTNYKTVNFNLYKPYPTNVTVSSGSMHCTFHSTLKPS